MSLLDHAIWWHVYPLGALGTSVFDRSDDEAPTRPWLLEGWLDHAVDLGCSGLLLGPIFDSVSHGYDTLDHQRVDPRLGTDADFDEFIAQAARRGLAVVLDGVFNHVALEHRWVEASLRGEGEGAGNVAVERDGDQPRLPTWEGHDSLVSLDHSSAAVIDAVTEIMLHWLRRGISGWRLDVAYAVPSEFWREVCGRVRSEFPDALFIGEVIHGDYPAIAAAGTLDSVTQYELWKAIWSSIKDRNFWELAHGLERHDEMSSHLVLQTFIGNHDVDRIASLVGEDGAVLAISILATVAGMPSIYYGDEYGFTGTKDEGFRADAPLRPALPPSPDDIVLGTSMLRRYQQLIGLRRRHSWLSTARTEVLEKTNTTIRYRSTESGGSASLTVSLTVDDAPSVSIEASDGEHWFWRASDS